LTAAYCVEASSEAEAIVKALDGYADPMDGSHTFVEVAECGRPSDVNRELADELQKVGVKKLIRTGSCLLHPEWRPELPSAKSELAAKKVIGK
jgi:hypothetical protein